MGLCVCVCVLCIRIGIGNTICDIKLFAHAKHNSKQFKSILNVKFVLLQVFSTIYGWNIQNGALQCSSSFAQCHKYQEESAREMCMSI